jgi:hypothetical protein
MSVKPEQGDTGGDSLLVVPPLVRQPLRAGRMRAPTATILPASPCQARVP